MKDEKDYVVKFLTILKTTLQLFNLPVAVSMLLLEVRFYCFWSLHPHVVHLYEVQLKRAPQLANIQDKRKQLSHANIA